jgi:hypothetical protein
LCRRRRKQHWGCEGSFALPGGLEAAGPLWPLGPGTCAKGSFGGGGPPWQKPRFPPSLNLWGNTVWACRGIPTSQGLGARQPNPPQNARGSLGENSQGIRGPLRPGFASEQASARSAFGGARRSTSRGHRYRGSLLPPLRLVYRIHLMRSDHRVERGAFHRFSAGSMRVPRPPSLGLPCGFLTDGAAAIEHRTARPFVKVCAYFPAVRWVSPLLSNAPKRVGCRRPQTIFRGGSQTNVAVLPVQRSGFSSTSTSSRGTSPRSHHAHHVGDDGLGVAGVTAVDPRDARCAHAPTKAR